MAEIRPADADRYLASPPPETAVFLFFGTDPGTASERAATLVARVLAIEPERTIVRLTSEELTADPGRLSDEANAGSLFGGDPIIRIRLTDARSNLVPALAPVAQSSPPGVRIVIEAGDLKPKNALRSFVKGAANAAAIPCYEATPREISALAAQIADAFGNRFAPDALDAVADRLGSDRLAARREIEKLLLYAGPDATVTAAHVDAILGDSVALRSDRVTDAAFVGRIGEVEADLVRCRLEKTPLSAVAAQGLRLATQFQVLATRVDSGLSVANALAAARPPIFFKRRDTVAEILRNWSSPAVASARRTLGKAIAETRKRPDLEDALVSRAFISIALRARALSK